MLEDNDYTVIKWNEEKMSTKNEVIDEQHKNVLKLLNKLINSIKNATQAEDIEEIIDELSLSIDLHFKTEEGLLAEYLSEKQLQEHKNEHDEFKEKIVKIKSRFYKENHFKENHAIETLTILFQDLSEWFITHDIYEDRKILN